MKSVDVVSKISSKKAVALEDDGDLKASAIEAVETWANREASSRVYTYEMLRNMEMLVVARVLSRPEPPIHERGTCFYVSKSWCKAALRWLEVQEEERKEKIARLRAVEETKAAAAAAALASPKGKKNARHPGSSGKKKMSRKEMKEQRARERRNSDAMPPWSNINDDIMCEHGDLKHCSGKSARARRRTMDKKAWKVLKKLYPDSVQLEAGAGVTGCLMCTAESEAAKKAAADKKEEAKAERKKPLACPLVRGFYSRGNKGYPVASSEQLQASDLKSDDSFSPIHSGASMRQCPLKPGVYWTLPRSWCKNWRKYLKTGEGGLPPPPDGSEMLCDAHNLPLVPPHLEAFLSGDSSTLYGSPISNASTLGAEGVARIPNDSLHVSGVSDAEILQALRAAGLSEVEMHSQRVAMAQLEEQRQQAFASRFERQISLSEHDRAATNEQLDRENRVVGEILTDEEVSALEKWWPHVNIMYGIRFAVVETESGCREVLWHTLPCRECDPSSRADTKFHLRSRAQRGFH